MVNFIAPAAIIFCNADLSDNVLTTIQRQLFITDTMTGVEFDARIAVDPDYPDEIHGNGRRVLVIRSFLEHTNRQIADLVLFVKNGLASVEASKFGPPGITYPVDRMYLSQIFNTNHN